MEYQKEIEQNKLITIRKKSLRLTSLLVSMLKRSRTIHCNSSLCPASCLVFAIYLALVLTPASLITYCDTVDSDIKMDLNFIIKAKPHGIFFSFLLSQSQTEVSVSWTFSGKPLEFLGRFGGKKTKQNKNVMRTTL